MPDPAEIRVEDLNHVLGADTVIPDLERSEMSIPLSRVSLLVLTRDKLPVRLSAPGEVTQDTYRVLWRQPSTVPAARKYYSSGIAIPYLSRNLSPAILRKDCIRHNRAIRHLPTCMFN